MDQDIRIIGEPQTEVTCKFTVDQPVFPGNSIYFSSAEDAKGSPLAERLFAIENVASVLIGENRVTVTQTGGAEWPVIGKLIGEAIREHVATGDAAVDEAAANKIPSEELRNRVQELLDTQINPAVASHGGMISLIEVTGNTIYLQLGGGCQGCGMANVTLRQGVEQAIRASIPEAGEVLDVTDHATGANPYYSPEGQ